MSKLSVKNSRKILIHSTILHQLCFFRSQIKTILVHTSPQITFTSPEFILVRNTVFGTLSFWVPNTLVSLFVVWVTPSRCRLQNLHHYHYHGRFTSSLSVDVKVFCFSNNWKDSILHRTKTVYPFVLCLLLPVKNGTILGNRNRIFYSYLRGQHFLKSVPSLYRKFFSETLTLRPSVLSTSQ